MIPPLGIPDSRALPAFSGEDTGPTHFALRNIFVREALKYRALMHKSGGAISAEYERLAKAAARFAAQHHSIGRVELAFAKESERDLPGDERRGVFQAVRS
jgi:hypothetical protein